MNILKYEQIQEYFPTTLVESKSLIPQWYKEASRNPVKNNKLLNGLKMCMPFLDSLTAGYMIVLPIDIVVEGPANNKTVRWRSDFAPLNIRPNTGAATLPIPEGFSEQHFVWVTPLALNINSKYSFILSHPNNRFDLPFITLSGIVDGGFDLASGNLPFFIKNSFEGVIPQGTPIAQIIPFKRENWQAKKEIGLAQKSLLNKNKSESVFSGWYQKTFWQKKEYEVK